MVCMQTSKKQARHLEMADNVQSGDGGLSADAGVALEGGRRVPGDVSRARSQAEGHRHRSLGAPLPQGEASHIKVARWQNLILTFPWIVPAWRAWGHNLRKGRDPILQQRVAEP